MKNLLSRRVDLDILIPYKYILDVIDIRFIHNEINNKGLIETIEYYLQDTDVSTNKFIQTIHFRYKNNISNLYLCFEILEKEDIKNLDLIDDYVDRLLNIHKSNIEYEVINPPPIYKKILKVKTKKTSNKKSKSIKSSKESKVKSRITIVNVETNKEVTLDRDLALSIIKDKPDKFKIKDGQS